MNEIVKAAIMGGFTWLTICAIFGLAWLIAKKLGD